MFITADQVLAHMIGDYVLQSHYLAVNKRNNSLICFFHVILYSPPFLFFKPSPWALNFILISHYFIDKYALARYVIFAKNWLIAPYPTVFWEDCKDTRFDKNTPAYLSTWLLIVVDNILHIVCNGIALKYF